MLGRIKIVSLNRGEGGIGIPEESSAPEGKQPPESPHFLSESDEKSFGKAF
jgi:hypothetical protein